MKALHALHFVTSKKEGARFSFSITDKGKEALNDKHDPDDVPDHMLNEAHKAKQAKEAGSAPASTTERPANTDIECPKCHTFNPFMAEFCKECGSVLRPVPAVPVAA
jgi:DNA-directed RNA polymerase subunit M/transcription elongation factor TFIIS